VSGAGVLGPVAFGVMEKTEFEENGLTLGDWFQQPLYDSLTREKRIELIREYKRRLEERDKITIPITEEDIQIMANGHEHCRGIIDKVVGIAQTKFASAVKLSNDLSDEFLDMIDSIRGLDRVFGVVPEEKKKTGH
jgi:hypothetical protein